MLSLVAIAFPVLERSPPPSTRAIPENLWKVIWRVKVPPKIRHFLWSTPHNAIAIIVELFRRRSSPIPTCPICHCQDETTEHLSLLCPWVETIWFGGPLNYKVDRWGISNWVQWLHYVFTSNLGSTMNGDWVQVYVATSCWYIWKARCDFVFNQVPSVCVCIV